jgi:hypothetical protein
MHGGHSLFTALWVYMKSIRYECCVKRTTHTDAVFLLSLIISATLELEVIRHNGFPQAMLRAAQTQSTTLVYTENLPAHFLSMTLSVILEVLWQDSHPCSRQ